MKSIWLTCVTPLLWCTASNLEVSWFEITQNASFVTNINFNIVRHLFASEVIMSYSSNWITLLLLCTRAPLVLRCDRFDRGFKTGKAVKKMTEGIATAHWLLYKTVHARCVTAQLSEHNVQKSPGIHPRIHITHSLGKVKSLLCLQTSRRQLGQHHGVFLWV